MNFLILPPRITLPEVLEHYLGIELIHSDLRVLYTFDLISEVNHISNRIKNSLIFEVGA